MTSQGGRDGPGETAVTAQSVRIAVHQELDHSCLVFHDLMSNAGTADLRRHSDGTRWTNQQLLFHMLFGYLIVLRLLPLVHLFGRLPDRASRVFAALLDSARVPFHVINFLGSWIGGRIVNPRLQLALMDRTLRGVHRRIDGEEPGDLFLRMHFPVGWDPFFSDTMTVADVYHFGTQHFDYHRAQLSLS